MPLPLTYPRIRDVETLFKGDSYTVAIDQAMAQAGWQGGQFVRWVDSSQDEFIVSFSDGLYGGFSLWGSNESSDQFTGMTGAQPLYGYITLCTGGWLIATRTFEKYTYASRQIGPLVPITYVEGVRLRISLRGLATTEDEWTLSGDPRAPNDYYIATVVQAPSSDNNQYLTLQTSI